MYIWYNNKKKGASDKAKRVIGVELNSDAVRDARVNAKINKIENIELYNKDAGEFMAHPAVFQAHLTSFLP